jgi:hypothetical protein
MKFVPISVIWVEFVLVTIVEACQEVGLLRSFYYDIIKKDPETIAGYNKLVQLNARQQRGMILANKTKILDKIIQVGLSDESTTGSAR